MKGCKPLRPTEAAEGGTTVVLRGGCGAHHFGLVKSAGGCCLMMLGTPAHGPECGGTSGNGSPILANKRSGTLVGVVARRRGDRGGRAARGTDLERLRDGECLGSSRTGLRLR